MAVEEGFGLFEGDSVEGDHGIVGRALVMLLSDRVLLGCWSFVSGLFGSVMRQLDPSSQRIRGVLEAYLLAEPAHRHPN